MSIEKKGEKINLPAVFRCAALVIVTAFGLLAIIGTGGSSGGNDDGPATVNVDESYNGGQVTLGVDDLLVVTLDSNASTGFKWSLSDISDEDVIWKTDSNYYDSSGQEGMVGAGGYEVWEFEAEDAGTATISMVYIQPWVDPPDPAATFDITVIVE